MMSADDIEISFNPPPFPDLFRAFQQTLAMSKNLSILVDTIPVMLNNTQKECTCQQASNTNWTNFNAKITGVPESLLSQCDTLYGGTVGPGGYAVSSSLAAESKALIIGISSGVVVALFIVVCVLLLFRRRASLLAVCPPLVQRHKKVHPQRGSVTSTRRSSVDSYRGSLSRSIAHPRPPHKLRSNSVGVVTTSGCCTTLATDHSYDLATARRQAALPSTQQPPDLLQFLGDTHHLDITSLKQSRSFETKQRPLPKIPRERNEKRSPREIADKESNSLPRPAKSGDSTLFVATIDTSSGTPQIVTNNTQVGVMSSVNSVWSDWAEQSLIARLYGHCREEDLVECGSLFRQSTVDEVIDRNKLTRF